MCRKFSRHCINLTCSLTLKIPVLKGMHLWLFFAQPQPAREVLIFSRKVFAIVGPPAPELNREIFPRESQVAPKALGSMVKLPLGIHKLTNKRCLFLDNTGRPALDQMAVIRNIVTIPDTIFKAALEKLKMPAAAQFEQAATHRSH